MKIENATNYSTLIIQQLSLLCVCQCQRENFEKIQSCIFSKWDFLYMGTCQRTKVFERIQSCDEFGIENATTSIAVLATECTFC